MLIPVLGMERWEPLPDYIGYEVSNLGHVRTYRSINGRGGLKSTPRLMKLQQSPGKPYLRVQLTGMDGRQRYVPVHQLVLMTFVGPRPTTLHEGCHNDGNHRNNALSNLRWGTPQDNADDRAQHGTQVRGVQVGLAKLTEYQVNEIKAALPTWKKGMGRNFARKFGVSDAAISAVKNNQTWRHL